MKLLNRTSPGAATATCSKGDQWPASSKLVQDLVGGDVARADMGEIAHTRTGATDYLLALLDRQVAIVEDAHERQVPFAAARGMARTPRMRTASGQPAA